MRVSATMTGLKPALDGELALVKRATTGAMREAVVSLKEELRDQIFAAGLGLRLTRSWQGKAYPENGNSLDPAGYVFSKAPNIVSFFSKDSIVTARNGRFLAVPTDDTPRGRGGSRMTVAEVEAQYGRRLVFVDPADRGFRTPSVRRAGVAFLVMPGLVIRKSSQRWRNPGARETARGRATSSVVMFILVPQVVGHKRLDLEGAAQRAAASLPGLVERLLGEAA